MQWDWRGRAKAQLEHKPDYNLRDNTDLYGEFVQFVHDIVYARLDRGDLWSSVILLPSMLPSR
jgi:hypothetical protein